MAFLLEHSMTMIWLVLLILLLGIELATVGLVCIWAAGGALAAMLLSMAGVSVQWQIITFVAVTVLLLFFTRPYALKFIHSNRERTNYQGMIGKTIRITERVDNLSETGATTVSGTDWTVRAEEEDEILEVGALAEVVRVSGVKLIVRRSKEG